MAVPTQPPPSLFPDDHTTLPPTWVEGAEVYHTIAQCSRLKAMRRNNRITGKPGIGMRLCFNCEDIVRTKRSG